MKQILTTSIKAYFIGFIKLIGPAEVAKGLVALDTISSILIILLYSLSYGEVWARRNVYSASLRYYKCAATHGTPSGTHGGGFVQRIPKEEYNTQGGV